MLSGHLNIVSIDEATTNFPNKTSAAKRSTRPCSKCWCCYTPLQFPLHPNRTLILELMSAPALFILSRSLLTGIDPGVRPMVPIRWKGRFSSTARESFFDFHPCCTQTREQVLQIVTSQETETESEIGWRAGWSRGPQGQSVYGA